MDGDWVSAFRDAKINLKAARFEMVYRSILHREFWMALNMEQIGSNSYAADWDRVGDRNRSDMWVTVTLQKD